MSVNSKNRGEYVVLKNLHFFFFNFCERGLADSRDHREMRIKSRGRKDLKDGEREEEEKREGVERDKKVL